MLSTFRNRLIVAALSASFMPLAQASDEPKHFKGVPSDTLQQAVDNLKAYAPKLAEILNKDTITPADMGEIHQLTYTLENAVIRLDEHIDHMEESLEDVHQASEKAQYDTVKTQGNRFLEKTDEMLKLKVQ